MVKILHLSTKEMDELKVKDWVKDKKGSKTYEVKEIKSNSVVFESYRGIDEFDIDFVENNLVKLKK